MKSSKSHEIDLPNDRDLYYHLERELHSQKDGKLRSTSSSKLAQNFKEYADLIANFPPLPLRYQHLILKQDWFMQKSQRKRIVGRSWNNAEQEIHHYVMTISSMVKNKHDKLRLQGRAHTSCRENVPSSARMPNRVRSQKMPHSHPNQQKIAVATTTNPYSITADLSLSRLKSEPMINDLDLSNASSIDDELNRLSAFVASVNEKVEGDAIIYPRVKNSPMPDFNTAEGGFPQSSRRRKSTPDLTYDMHQGPTKRRHSNPDISFLDGEACSEYNGINAFSFARRHSNPVGSTSQPMLKHQFNNDKSHCDLYQFVLQQSTMNKGSQSSGERPDSNNDGIYNVGKYPCYDRQKQPNLTDQQQPNCTLKLSLYSLDPSERKSNNVMSQKDLFFNSYDKMQNASVNKGSSATFDPLSSRYSLKSGLQPQKHPNLGDQKQLNHTFNPSVSNLTPSARQPNDDKSDDDLFVNSYNNTQNTTVNRGSPDLFDSTDNLNSDAMYKDGYLSPVYPTFRLPTQEQPNSAASEQPNYTSKPIVYQISNDSSQDDHFISSHNKIHNPSRNQGFKGSESTDTDIDNDVMYNNRFSFPRNSSSFDLVDNTSNHCNKEDLHKQIAHARDWVIRTYGSIKPAWVTQTHGNVKASPEDTSPNANK